MTDYLKTFDGGKSIPDADNSIYAFSRDEIATIRHALKLADKVTGEPSEGMIEEGEVLATVMLYVVGKIDVSLICRAMIAKAQEEIEDD